MSPGILLDGMQLPVIGEFTLSSLLLALLVSISVAAMLSVLVLWLRATRWQGRVDHLDTHDALTGLANRSSMEDRLEALAGKPCAVLLVELDRFATINNSFGREVGDRLVRSLAEHLQKVCLASETVGRWTGAQFMMICPDVHTHNEAERRATAVSEPLTAVARIGVDHIRVTVTVGATIVDERTTGATQALDEAAMALAIARNEGYGSIQVFDRTKTRPLSSHEAAERIRTALDEEQFSVMFAPVVALEGYRVVGVHATLHLADPEQGLVDPSIVRSLIAQCDHQAEVAIRFLETVVPQAARWVGEHPDADPVITFELTPGQIIDQGVHDRLEELLDETGLPPGNLCVVLSSDSPFEPAITWEPLRELKALDVLVGLDDFGEGWASIAFLRRLTVDVIKMAPSLTESVNSSREDLTIAQQLFSLTTSLNLIGIATGVTDARQTEALHGLGCTLAQGPWFAGPTTAQGMEALLASGTIKPGRRRGDGIDWKAPTPA